MISFSCISGKFSARPLRLLLISLFCIPACLHPAASRQPTVIYPGNPTSVDDFPLTDLHVSKDYSIIEWQDDELVGIIDNHTGELLRYFHPDTIDTNSDTSCTKNSEYGYYEFNTDGKIALRSNLTLFDLETGKKQNNIPCKTIRDDRVILITPDSRHALISNIYDAAPTVACIDLMTGDTVRNIKFGVRLQKLWINNDNKGFTTISHLGDLCTWDIGTMEKTHEVNIPELKYDSLLYYGHGYIYKTHNDDNILFMDTTGITCFSTKDGESAWTLKNTNTNEPIYLPEVKPSEYSDVFAYYDKNDSCIKLACLKTGTAYKKITGIGNYKVAFVSSFMPDSSEVIVNIGGDGGLIQVKYNIVTDKFYLYHSRKYVTHIEDNADGGTLGIINFNIYMLTGKNNELLDLFSFVGNSIPAKDPVNKSLMYFADYYKNTSQSRVLKRYNIATRTIEELLQFADNQGIASLGFGAVDKFLLICRKDSMILKYDCTKNMLTDSMKLPVFLTDAVEVSDGRFIGVYEYDGFNYAVIGYNAETNTSEKYNKTWPNKLKINLFLKKYKLLALVENQHVNFYDLTAAKPFDNPRYSLDFQTDNIMLQPLGGNERYLICTSKNCNYMVDLSNMTYKKVSTDNPVRPVRYESEQYYDRLANNYCAASLSNDNKTLYYTDKLCNLYVEDVSDFTGVEVAGAAASAGLKIYPNPAQGSFRFEYAPRSAGETRVRIFNTLGGQVYERSEALPTDMVSSIEVNMKDVPAGAYRLAVENGGSVAGTCVMIMK